MSKCNNCDKYDYKTHSCHIFCDVIKNTIEDVRADERTKTIDALMDEVAQVKGISDEDWDLLEQKAKQMKEQKNE